MGISIAFIKKLVMERYGVKMDDEAAREMSKMLEAKASEIANYAVKHARDTKNSKVTAEDIDAYKLNCSD